MPNINVVTMTGRIGTDLELTEVSEGINKVQFSFAVEKKYKDTKKTNWFTVVAWRKLAEIIVQYSKKGDKVAICGELESHSWEDKDGNKKYSVEISANTFENLTPKQAN